MAVKQKICRVMTLEYLRFSAVKLLLTVVTVRQTQEILCLWRPKSTVTVFEWLP